MPQTSRPLLDDALRGLVRANLPERPYRVQRDGVPREQGAPLTLLYFATAALCLQHNSLGDSWGGVFIAGGLCLTLSLRLPIASRLRAYRRDRRRRGAEESS
jgi:hypothetical protein